MRRIILLAHNVRSLWNVGAFFRTADAFAIEKIYLTGYTAAPPRKEIAKVALGADETVPFEHVQSPLPAIARLKAEGWTIVALEQTPEATPLANFVAPTQVCLIVGHEVDGVSADVLAETDAVVEIPMHGTKESLNVAVATGIALHSLRIQAD